MTKVREDFDWPFKYPHDDLSRTMAAAALRADTNELDNGSQPSAMVGFSKARSRSATVEDNTHNQGGNHMPTVKQQPAKKRTNRKASPVTTSVERTFVTDPKKAETPGTYRFKEDHEEPVIVSLYLRKDETEKLFGQRPSGVKVTIEPIF